MLKELLVWKEKYTVTDWQYLLNNLEDTFWLSALLSTCSWYFYGL